MLISKNMKKNLGTLERVRNSRGKRAMNVRATEILLYAQHVCIVAVFSESVSCAMYM